jgi:hypothetical protein
MLGPAGEPLDYSRIDAFNMPYLGSPELLPTEELQNSSRTFRRFGFGLFSVGNPSQRACSRTYGEVMEGIANLNWQLCHKGTPHITQDGDVLIYLEWFEPYAINKSTPIPPRVEDDQKPVVLTEDSNASPDKQPRRVIRRRVVKKKSPE